MPVHAYGNGEVKMAHAAIGEGDINEPAIGAKLFIEAGLHFNNVATKKTRRVHQMTAMGQHVIAAQIGFGIDGGFFGSGAQNWQRLHGISHGITMG